MPSVFQQTRSGLHIALFTPLAAALLWTASTPFSLSAQQPATPVAATPAQAGAIELQGTVADPDAAVIQGATVTLTPIPAKGAGYSVKSGGDGTYSFKGVPTGNYSLTAAMPGFATYVRQLIKITDGVSTTANIKMIIGDQSQTITVTAEDNQISVDPEKNAGGATLSAKDLEAFSDDPDELSSELQALAGPAAGPNGGQIYIDGFTGGQLPPKSSIREIRINQNPFSAQYDQPGFGRVEIFTKPGTDKLHGDFRLNGLDRALNTGSPLIPASTIQPGYHSILTFDSLSGAINKHASYSANGSYRNIQTNSIVNPPAIYATSQSSGTPCAPGTPMATSACKIFATLPGTTTGGTNYAGGNGFTFAQFTPQTRYDFGPRFDLALGEKNTLTVRFAYEHNASQNQQIGGNDLPSTGYNSTSSETTLQVSDTQIISPKVINETRFEFQREAASDTPFNSTPAIVVQGAFNSGGYRGQSSTDIQPHFEVQNYTSIALEKHFLRFGGRLRTTAEQNTTTAGSNGTFVYSGIGNYMTNTLSNFTITKINVPTVNITSADVGVYAEDDWKIIPKLTFSYGLRYETQNYINDRMDFAPRLAVAYGLNKKTVLRAGFGLFYQRFLPQNQEAVIRNNGTNQQQTTLSAQTANGSISNCSPTNIAGCNAVPGATNELTIQTAAPNLHAPYFIQENIGVDQQLFRNATLAVNYQHIQGVHQFYSDVPNYLTAASTGQLNYQYQSGGSFQQNQLIANANIRGLHGITLFGYYVLNFANGDTSGIGTFASVPTNLKADYGRTGFDIRNRVFMGGSWTLPHLLQLSPFLVAQSGTPYNITSGQDQFHTNIYNYRAVAVPLGTQSIANGYVKTIAGCGTFATPGTLNNTTEVPINSCTGPANFTLNLRVTKTWGFGPSTSPKPDQGGGQRGPGGPGGGPGGRGGGRGGPGGFGGGASSGKRYNLTLGAQGQNLFNIVDRATPVGTLSSPSFGTSTQLAGRFFTQDDAVRRIQLQIGLSF